MRPRLLTLALLWPLAASAQADDRRVLARDDIEFARALQREGYGDLAEEVVKAVQRTRSDAGADIEIYRIDSSLDAAEGERDAKKRKDIYVSVLRAKEKFVEKHKGTPAADRVASELPDLHRVVGEAIAAAVKKETDPTAAEALARQGREMFQRAEESLVERRDAAREKRDDDERAYAACGSAWFDLLRTRFFHSKLVSDANEREKLLRGALKDMEDFELDYGSELIYYEAAVYIALIHKDLGDTKAALAHLDTAIRLREVDCGEKDSRGMWPMQEAVADVVSAAVLQKVMLQSGLQDHTGAAATAQDFLTTTPSPLQTAQGAAILAAQAEAFAALGDFTSAEAAAKRLVAADPNGPWGARGRTILGEGRATAAMGPAELIRIAETFAAKRDWDRSAELCARAIAAARGTPGGANDGSAACELLGAVWAQRGALLEAIVAWEGAEQHFPDGEKSPECLWRAINAWMTLASQEKHSAYAKKGREGMALLADRYPKHPYAGMAAIVEAQRLESGGEFLAAAEAYLKVEPSSTAYPEAQYRAGNALQKEVWRLSQDRKTDAAKALAARADHVLRKARTDLEAAATKTLDESVRAKLSGLAFRSRIALANLCLCDAVGRSADVAGVLEGAETAVANDAAQTAAVWELRFRALQSQGKLDDARKMLDGQLLRDPGAAALRPAALALARALDRQAKEMLDKEPRSQEALGRWRAAARYYDVWCGSYLRGEVSAEVSDVEAIAGRLYVIGLALNDVPEGVTTFTDWRGEVREPGPLRTAAKVYEAVAANASSHTVILLLARTNGFLGEWAAAADAYARVFERVPVVDQATKRFDPIAIRDHKELVQAWTERGVVEREAALAERDNGRLARAFGVFEVLATSVPADSKLWWLSRFHLCRIQFDKGDYEGCDFSVRTLERNSEGFDGGRFGYRELFEKLKEELKGKVVRR